jgi:hypothetical protein
MNERISMKHLFSVFALAAVFVISGCGEPEPSDTPVPVQAVNALDTITISPSDTLGILMGDSNYVFGTIGDALCMENGNIAVLDETACCAKVYDSEGVFVQQISRGGTGPGEVLAPGGMVRLSDGSLLILDYATGGAHRFSANGDFLELFINFQGQPVPQWAWGVDNLCFVGAVTETVMQNDILTVNYTIGRWGNSTEPSVSYFVNSFPFNPERMDEYLQNTFFSSTFAADCDGMVSVAPISSSDYLINVYNRDGGLCSTIRRDIPRVEKTQAEIDDETAVITAILKERGVPEDMINYRADPYRWFIPPQGLAADGQGRIWARSGTCDRVIMDVYSRAGDHLAVVELLGVTNPDIVDFLNIKVQQNRILVYSLQDPDYPRLYILEIPEIQ